MHLSRIDRLRQPSKITPIQSTMPVTYGTSVVECSSFANVQRCFALSGRPIPLSGVKDIAAGNAATYPALRFHGSCH